MKNILNNKWFIIPALFLVFGAVAVIATTIGDSDFSGIQVDNYFSGSGKQGITQNIYFNDSNENMHLFEFEDGLLVNYSMIDVSIPSDLPFEGLISYWKMDESSGDMIDSFGSFDGTVAGDVIQNSIGVINTGYAFDGSTNAVNVGSSVYGGNLSAVTWSLWFKADSPSSDDGIIGIASGVENPRITLTSNTLIATAVVDSGMAEVSTSFSDVSSWHHVITTYDSTDHTFRLYLDGNEIGSDDSEYGNVSNLGGDLAIGLYNSGTYSFDGSIDEVGIWNRALNETEIQKIYNNGTGLSY